MHKLAWFYEWWYWSHVGNLASRHNGVTHSTHRLSELRIVKIPPDLSKHLKSICRRTNVSSALQYIGLNNISLNLRCCWAVGVASGVRIHVRNECPNSHLSRASGALGETWCFIAMIYLLTYLFQQNSTSLLALPHLHNHPISVRPSLLAKPGAQYSNTTWTDERVSRSPKYQ